MTASNAPVITVDGPSGAGKGTVGRSIAAWLGWHYLDSGALYRALAYAAKLGGLALDDASGLAKLAANLDLRFADDGPESRVLLDGMDVSAEIRTEEAGEAASKVASLEPVRTALLGRQRAFATPPGLVADGRDMGTVVFPDAEHKLFLTASPMERANRRHKQLSDKGINVSLPALANEIAERDARDARRAVSPTRPAADARIVDSTNITANSIVEDVKQWLRVRGVKPVD